MGQDFVKVEPAIVERWWQEFISSGRKIGAFRDRLIEHYLYIVKHVVERIHARLPEGVEKDDLLSAGVFGLLATIGKFEPERNVRFETYCHSRIRGSVLDEIRNMDWVPRLTRERAHKIDNARNELETKLGRKATEQELARKLKMSPRQFQQLRRDARTFGVISLSQKCFGNDSSHEVCEIDTIEDKRSENPLTQFQQKQVREWIIKGLSRAERLIIILYYFEKMSMKEIGDTIGVAESRISQMHQVILCRFRVKLMGGPRVGLVIN